MAKIVTLNLALPYRFRKSDTTLEPEALRKARLQVTEQMVFGASNQLHPQGMTRAHLRMIQPVMDALADEQDTVELDGSQFEFLYDLFLSKQSQDTVKFTPGASGWVALWLDYLETTYVSHKTVH
jgi:hypothetical protein